MNAKCSNFKQSYSDLKSSPFHLNKLFNEIFNTSVRKYLIIQVFKYKSFEPRYIYHIIANFLPLKGSLHEFGKRIINKLKGVFNGTNPIFQKVFEKRKKISFLTVF